MQNVKKQRRKRVIRSVIHVSIALIISIIPLFCCAFSTIAATQAYFTMLSPTSATLWNQETISQISGFNQIAVVNNFSNPIGANYALTLYRYRTDDWYYWTDGEVQSFSVEYDLSRGIYMAPGTYRVRFYVECGIDNIYKPWWEDLNDKQIQDYIDSYFKPGTLPTSWNFTYIQLGTRYIPLIPSNRSTVVYSDGAERVLEFYDYTFTTDTSVSNIFLNVAVRYNLSAAGSTSLRTRFTSGVSQASIDTVYESSADAPIFPGLDNSVVDDFNNQSSQLEDFAASQESVISGYLNPDFSGAPEFTEAMLGISHIIDKYVFRMEPVQRILGMGVAIGLICVLFGIGAVYARARFDREDQEERQREREIARENREVERALERDKRDRYNRSYEKYASDRARREQYAQRYNKEKKGD